MKITIRDMVKELLENEYLLVEYRELPNGGFDLSVRIDEEKLNKPYGKVREIKDNE